MTLIEQLDALRATFDSATHMLDAHAARGDAMWLLWDHYPQISRVLKAAQAAVAHTDKSMKAGFPLYPGTVYEDLDNAVYALRALTAPQPPTKEQA